jgi:hypothetical protein
MAVHFCLGVGWSGVEWSGGVGFCLGVLFLCGWFCDFLIVFFGCKKKKKKKKKKHKKGEILFNNGDYRWSMCWRTIGGCF